VVTLHADAPGAGPFSVFPIMHHAHGASEFFKIRGINIDHREFEDFMFRMAPINDFKCEAVTAGDLEELRDSAGGRPGSCCGRSGARDQAHVRDFAEGGDARRRTLARESSRA
jgi:hypothetical protein